MTHFDGATAASTSATRRLTPRAEAAVLAAIVAALSSFTLWWWSTYRRGMPWFIDEAGYLTFAIDHGHAIRDDGLAALVTDRLDGAYGPLVPTLSGTALAAVNRPYGVAVATMVVSATALLLASWFLARQVVRPQWAVLVAAVVGTCPIVLELTGMYYFAVPAAALYTFALACLLRGGYGTRAGWSVAGGISLGLATLARTMVLGLAPAIVVVAVWGAWREPDGRARRLATLAVSGVVGLLVMAPWWIPNLRTVLDYLGRPPQAARVGQAFRTRGEGRAWQVTGMHDLRLLISDLLLPTVVVLLVLALLAFVTWRRRGSPRDQRSIRGLTLAGVVILASGVLVYAGDAVGQWIPILPAMVVLAVSGLSQLTATHARQLGVGVLCAIMAFNLTVASRAIPSLSEPRLVSLGPLGRVSVTDGRWLLEEQRRRAELDPGGRLPRYFEGIEAGVGHLVRKAADRADAAGEPAVLVAPHSADQILSTNVLALTDRLIHDRPRLIIGGLLLPEVVDAAHLRTLLADPESGQPNLVLSVMDATLENTLPSIGFTAIDRLDLPEGEHATLWWRARADIEVGSGSG